MYWLGVGLRARQIKRRTGRTPNMRPGTQKEKLLWAGWVLVSAAWASAPFLGTGRLFEGPVSTSAGVLFILAGLAGTYWAHASMGDAWRIAVRLDDKAPLVTSGPYSRIRHPLYAFQCVILLGVFLLEPSPITLFMLFIHRLLVAFKIRDEEKYLAELHGPLYKEYALHTGSLWPKFKRT